MARKYVAAIAGLRAVAVLSIVMYHLDSSWIPGGFVGVDIFFVLSGFVVAHSVTNGSYDSFGSYVAWFYKRRFQRILPTGLLYIATAAVFSLLLIPIAPASKFLEITGIAAIFGLSNIVLWWKAGDYFAASSELNIFTHTWSLAVEEQYYILFPLFSYFIITRKNYNNRSRNAAIGVVVFLCILSFVSSALLSKSSPSFAFYMLPTRFWELGTGFLLRVSFTEANVEWLTRHTRPLAPFLAATAVGALVAALVITDPHRFPFPGAILPCFATLLLIAVVWCHPNIWIDRLLSLSLPVWLGNISYSLYLWHWGVIVIMRWTIGIVTFPLRLAALATMLMLSYLSYTRIEQAFHNSEQRKRPPTLRFFLGFGLAAASVACICLTSFLFKPSIGLSVANNRDIWDPYLRPKLSADCPVDKQNRSFGAGQMVTFRARCDKPDAPQLFILGDSHAGAYQRAAWRIAGTGRYRVTLWTLGGCRPILLSKLPDIPGCTAFLEGAEQEIRSIARPGDVLFLAGLQTTRYRTPTGEPLAKRPLELTEIVASRIRLQALARLGPTVIVEGAKPVAFSDLYRCSDWFNRDNPDCMPTDIASSSETLRRVALANQGIAMVATDIPAVMLWKPDALLCERKVCPEFIDGKPLYFDNDHLSAFGNDRLFSSLLFAIDAAHMRSEATNVQ